MEVSNRKSNIILIVSIILILGIYYAYNNYDKLSKYFESEYETTSNIKQSIIGDNTLKYECQEGYYLTDYESGETPSCIKTEIPMESYYECPEGSHSDKSEISYATRCYYDEVILPNSCSGNYSDNGTGCTSNTPSKVFDKSVCNPSIGEWQEDGCHVTTSYSCPSGYETDFEGFTRLCIKFDYAKKIYNCVEGTYNEETALCVYTMEATQIKEDK